MEEKPFDPYTRNEKGEFTVSENNTERDIAFLFSIRGMIEEKLTDIAHSSTLSEQTRIAFVKVITRIRKKIEETASWVGMQNDDANSYRLQFLKMMETMMPDDLSDEEKNEWKECVRASNAEMLELFKEDNRQAWVASRYSH